MFIPEDSGKTAHSRFGVLKDGRIPMKQKEAVKGIVGRGNEKRGKENPSVKQAYSCVKLRVDPSPGNSG